MTKNREKDISAQVINKAKEFGACLIGIANVEALKKSPSHLVYGKLDEDKGVGTKETAKIETGEVFWPENAKSAIIVAVEHPETEPELDWWKDGYVGGTAGNRMLISINAKLSEWLEKEKRIKTIKLPYHIGNGGIFLKDAAVVAGLGCIGKNNLLVTPEFGPRVRLRAMFTDEVLPGAGPMDIDPCEDCNMPCRKACPQEAFRSKIYSEKEFKLDKLPGRTGVYSKNLCNVQMELDAANCEKIEVEGRDESGKLIRYCRICESVCPIGKTD